MMFYTLQLRSADEGIRSKQRATDKQAPLYSMNVSDVGIYSSFYVANMQTQILCPKLISYF